MRTLAIRATRKSYPATKLTKRQSRQRRLNRLRNPLAMDVAHVQLVAVATNGPVIAFLGEVRGDAPASNVLHRIVIEDDADPWAAVRDLGFERKPDPYP